MPVVRIILLLCLAVLSAPAVESPAQHFLTFVKPLLDSRCVSCHGPDKVKASLRLDSREALLRGGDSGPVVIPGKPADSLTRDASGIYSHFEDVAPGLHVQSLLPEVLCSTRPLS